jgi:hypothetical protein
VIGQLPLLSETGLLVALDMFYSRLRPLDIPVLKAYLDHSDIRVRMSALNIICETIAFVSHRNRDVEEKLRPKHYHHLLAAINDLKTREQVCETELEEQFLKVCNGVMTYVETWLEYSGYIWS